MNNLLCDVPDDLFMRCFLPFWNIQEAIQLDKAVNNRAIRQELNEKLKGHVFTASRPFFMDINAWILLAKRDYYVDNYYVPRDDMFGAAGALSKLNAHVKSLSLAERTTRSAQFVFETYINNCPKLSKLDLRDVTDKKVELFEFISPQLLSQLTWFSLENYRCLDARCLPTIAKHCTKLEHLNISGTNLYMSAQHAECIAKLTHLTHLAVGFCEVTNETLSTIVTGCSQLTSLDLSGCTEITDTGLETIAERLPGLKVLRIAHCYLVTDNALLNLMMLIPILEEVDFENCLFLTERSLVSMVILCRNLRSINLSKVPEVSDRFLLVAAGLPQLTELNLSNNEQITDENLILLAQSACGSKLTTLNLAWCVNLTDASVLAIAAHCVNLQHLNLDSSLQAVEGPVGLEVGGRTQVTAASVAVLATRCAHLVSLNVANVIGVDDATVAAIAQHCTKLHSLNLYGCNLITDASAESITEHCTRLRTLNLSCCRKLTSLANIRNCLHLRTLNIKGCVNMSRHSISSSIINCTNLKDLNVQGCVEVNDPIVMMCKDIRRLNIAQCPLVSDLSVEEIVRWSNKLRYLNVSDCTRLTGELISYLLTTGRIEVILSARQLALTNPFNHAFFDDDASESSAESAESEGMAQFFAEFDQAQQEAHQQFQLSLQHLPDTVLAEVVDAAMLSSSSSSSSSNSSESSDGSGIGSVNSSGSDDDGDEDDEGESDTGEEVVYLSGAGAFSSEEDQL